MSPLMIDYFLVLLNDFLNKKRQELERQGLSLKYTGIEFTLKDFEEHTTKFFNVLKIRLPEDINYGLLFRKFKFPRYYTFPSRCTYYVVWDMWQELKKEWINKISNESLRDLFLRQHSIVE